MQEGLVPVGWASQSGSCSSTGLQSQLFGHLTMCGALHTSGSYGWICIATDSKGNLSFVVACWYPRGPLHQVRQNEQQLVCKLQKTGLSWYHTPILFDFSCFLTKSYDGLVLQTPWGVGSTLPVLGHQKSHLQPSAAGGSRETSVSTARCWSAAPKNHRRSGKISRDVPGQLGWIGFVCLGDTIGIIIPSGYVKIAIMAICSWFAHKTKWCSWLCEFTRG